MDIYLGTNTTCKWDTYFKTTGSVRILQFQISRKRIKIRSPVAIFVRSRLSQCLRSSACSRWHFACPRSVVSPEGRNQPRSTMSAFVPAPLGTTVSSCMLPWPSRDATRRGELVRESLASSRSRLISRSFVAFQRQFAVAALATNFRLIIRGGGVTSVGWIKMLLVGLAAAAAETRREKLSRERERERERRGIYYALPSGGKVAVASFVLPSFLPSWQSERPVSAFRDL